MSIARLFEPCPVLEELVAARVHPERYALLVPMIEATRRELLLFLAQLAKVHDFAKVDEIISAHPRLGPSRDTLSAHSTSEQRSLGSPEEAAQLVDLNRRYEAVFGFRFVVFVNGRSREAIMAEMEQRMANDALAERRAALMAMCDIALDRAKESD